MPGFSTNRDRATPFRGHRHYFRSPSRLGVWRTRLSALAFLLSIALVAAGFVRKERLRASVSHGPLIESHSTWSDRCDACHIPFGEPGCEAMGILACKDRWRAFRCNTCHPGPQADTKNYAPHYTSPLWKEDALSRDCSSCHHDHQGRDFALSKVADSGCVRCHGELRKMQADDSAGEYAKPVLKVTNFNSDHPEFRILKEESTPKRTLKFNHGLHMAHGLHPSTTDGQPVNADSLFTLSGVDPRFAEKYKPFATGSAEASSPIQLDCTACHQLDTGRGIEPPKFEYPGLPAEFAYPARPAGTYYLPITFEKHCQACHNLKTSTLATTKGVEITGFEIPHRLQPPAVDQLIRGEIARQIEAKDRLLLKIPLPPNDRLDSPRSIEVPATLKQETDRLAKLYNMLLYDRTDTPRQPNASAKPPIGGYACLKCHTAAGDDQATYRPNKIEPTTARTIWLPNSRFDHSAHRVVNCADCHNMWDKQGDAKRMGAIWTAETLNLPGIGTCQSCHAPSSWKDGKPMGGVQHACVDCHRYHAGERPLQGPGAPSRNPPADRRFDIESFLRGPRTVGSGR